MQLTMNASALMEFLAAMGLVDRAEIETTFPLELTWPHGFHIIAIVDFFSVESAI